MTESRGASPYSAEQLPCSASSSSPAATAAATPAERMEAAVGAGATAAGGGTDASAALAAALGAGRVSAWSGCSATCSNLPPVEHVSEQRQEARFPIRRGELRLCADAAA